MTEHPIYRVETENTWDHVLGFELRIMPGDVLHLHVRTLYKFPTVTEARGGVAIAFGENVSFVTIPNLDRAYRVFAEPSWYGVEAIFVPVANFDAQPVIRDIFALDEQVVAHGGRPE